MSAFEAGCRRAALVWHRRAGKDKVGLAVTSKELWDRPGVYWHLFPLLNQGRKILWDGRGRDGKSFLDAFPAEIIKRKLDQEMKIEFTNGSLWQVVGVDNVDALVGANPRGIVFSEWSLMDPLVWKLLQPILLENLGWAMFIYTPRGKNHGHKTYLHALRDPEWFCSMMTVKDTFRDSIGEFGGPVISEIDIDKIRHEGDEEGAVPDEDTIQQEYYCSFSGNLQGAIYGPQMTMAERENRITRVPWNPQFPVHTAWDLGLSDSTVVGCFQIIGREWRWINFYENKKMGNKVSKEGYEAGMLGGIKWVREQPYTFARHYGPHDLEAGEISSGKSRVDFAKDHGLIFEVVKKHSIEDGIDAVRRQFSSMIFDVTNCDALINAARSYRYEWNDKIQSFSKKPLHDFASHGCDMLRYAVCGYIPEMRRPMPTSAVGMDFNPLNYERDNRPMPVEAAHDFDPFTGRPYR
jgi:hypothetical protein